MGDVDKNRLVNMEDFISMLLGLLIVGVVVVVLINYFKSRSGRVDLDGVTDITTIDSQDEKKTSDDGFVGEKYVVKKGDSLWKIAVEYYGDGYKWIEIAKANNISLKDADSLIIGQKLTLLKVEKVNLPVDHIVSLGESLSKIALNYYGDMFAWQKIYDANKNVVDNPNLIPVGLKLVIPE